MFYSISKNIVNFYTICTGGIVFEKSFISTPNGPKYGAYYLYNVSPWYKVDLYIIIDQCSKIGKFCLKFKKVVLGNFSSKIVSQGAIKPKYYYFCLNSISPPSRGYWRTFVEIYYRPNFLVFVYGIYYPKTFQKWTKTLSDDYYYYWYYYYLKN